jgi:hypothetical protein
MVLVHLFVTALNPDIFTPRISRKGESLELNLFGKAVVMAEFPQDIFLANLLFDSFFLLSSALSLRKSPPR